MSDYPRRVLESKRQTRKRLAELPFARKFILLEKRRDRSLLNGFEKHAPKSFAALVTTCKDYHL